MMRIQNRIGPQTIRKELQSTMEIICTDTIGDISEIIQKSTTKCTNQYIDVLKYFSLPLDISYRTQFQIYGP